MAIRYARTNELGLVVAPPKLDCLQDECPTAKVIGRCFPDRHHLYFPAAKFAHDALLSRFAQNPFNIVTLPRCRHNSRFSGAQHSMYDDVHPPSREVIHEFLFEAKILTDIGQIACRLDTIYEALTTENPQKAARDPSRYRDHFYEFYSQMTELTQSAESFEVIPLRQRSSPHCLGAIPLLGAQRELPLAA